MRCGAAAGGGLSSATQVVNQIALFVGFVLPEPDMWASERAGLLAAIEGAEARCAELERRWPAAQARQLHGGAQRADDAPRARSFS